MNDLLRTHETAGSAISPYWTKSSLSHANGNCVEVAQLPERQVGMRDSKDADGLVLRFPQEEWRAFLDGVLNGEFDRFAARQ